MIAQWLSARLLDDVYFFHSIKVNIPFGDNTNNNQVKCHIIIWFNLNYIYVFEMDTEFKEFIRNQRYGHQFKDEYLSISSWDIRNVMIDWFHAKLQSNRMMAQIYN